VIKDLGLIAMIDKRLVPNEQEVISRWREIRNC
jgi:hypothetical protein